MEAVIGGVGEAGEEVVVTMATGAPGEGIHGAEASGEEEGGEEEQRGGIPPQVSICLCVSVILAEGIILM